MADLNNKDNITIGRPKVGGAIYVAPAGTPLPTNGTQSLGKQFANLGYVSEDGVTISTAEESDAIKAWGPEDVMNAQTDFTVTATFNLLETVKKEVLEFIRGNGNVKVEEDTSVEAVLTGEPLPRCVVVLETIHNNGSDHPRIHRIVFGDAQITDRSGDQTFNNSDPLTYPVTMTAYKFPSQAIPGKMTYQDDYWSSGAAVLALEVSEIKLDKGHGIKEFPITLDGVQSSQGVSVEVQAEEANWLSASLALGKLIVNYRANSTENIRKGTIVVTGPDGQSVTLPVTQEKS